MNQLEYFLASTHGSRCDIMRYMQQLRDLDEWIEHHLTLLRTIAAERMTHLAVQARERQLKDHRSSRGNGSAAGRGARARGHNTAPPTSSAGRHRVYDVDAGSQGEDALSSASAGETAAEYMSALEREFAWHEACVRRHCHERDALAAELAERCAEVRVSMTSHLANFASVADVPMTELSG